MCITTLDIISGYGFARDPATVKTTATGALLTLRN